MTNFAINTPAACRGLRMAGYGVICVFMLCASATTWGASAASSGAGFKIAPGVVLLPSFGLRAIYTNNFYYQRNGQPKKGVWGYQATPRLTLLGDEGRYSFRLDGGAKAATFSAPGDKDDFVDHSVNGEFGYSLTPRNSLSLVASHKRSHDDFGLDRTEATTPAAGLDLDKWTRYKAGAVYSFGAPGTRFGLNLGYNVVGKDYQTNRAGTAGTRYLDYNTRTASVTGLYHYSGKTTFLANVRHTNIHIAHEFPGALKRSGYRNMYLVGVQWQATGKTSGDARVGYLQRESKDSRVDNFGKVAWEVGVNWSPIVRAQLRLETGRMPQVTYFFNSYFIDNRYYQLSLTYDWTARIQSIMRYRHTRQDFVGLPRADNLDQYWVTATYKLTRLWKLNVGVVGYYRDSDFSVVNFDRTYVHVGVQYSQ